MKSASRFVFGCASRMRTSLVSSLLGLFFAGLFAVTSAMAQQADSKGTDFWLMFNANLTAPTMTLFIAGEEATNGTVEIPGLAFSTPFNVVPGTATTVSIPAAAEVTAVDTVQNKGIHVTASKEVTVYGLNQRANTTDAFLGLPTDILGTEYINQGYKNVNIVNATQFGVVATEDNTTVTITPTVNSGARPAGVPYNVSMNRGSTYQLRSVLSSPADLSGSIISADKPIAVFGGHQCANIHNGNTVACDHIVEEITPTSTWGQAFVTFPLATRLSGDTFRVMASADVTSVSVNGANVAILNRGEIYETILISASTITADKPVLVTQYSNGTSWDNVTSDPFEVVVPPFEQFLASYTISTPPVTFQINYVNVVVANAGVGAVVLDGVPIPAGSYSAIGASGFSGAQVPVTVGSHTLSAPVPFGLISYGFADADSYGYPGGLGLSEVAELTDLTLAPKTATNPINTEHCVVATTLDQQSDPLPGIRVDFVVTGVNPTNGFEFTQGNGEAQFCYTGTNAGDDLITATVGALSDTATKTWTDTPAVACDIDNDGDVDRNDISLITAARNAVALPGDPRDNDANGVINVSDARQCTLLCTLARCATP